MNRSWILGKVDHTLLTQTATWEEVKGICEEAIRHKTASVCIPPSFVKKAAEVFGDQLAICTVVGFPNGYNTTGIKVAETVQAIKDGADEIDMVINLGMLKDGQYDDVRSEIAAIKEACGDKVLKVIVETCLLTDEEKVKMCQVVTEAGADFIKTSTGFSKAGATLEDVKLFSQHVGANVQIKAAGGIGSFEDAEQFIAAGASRLGSSGLVRLAEQEESGAPAGQLPEY